MTEILGYYLVDVSVLEIPLCSGNVPEPVIYNGFCNTLRSARAGIIKMNNASYHFDLFDR